LSSSTDSPIPVGRIGRPHGIRGEVTVLVATDDPNRFAPGARVTTEDGRVLTVTSATPYRDSGLVIGFSGVTDRTAAEALRGLTLIIDPTQRRDLDADEFWPEDLLGLEAVDPSGSTLGRVTRIEFGTAQDRLVVTVPGGGEVLVPFVAAIVGDPSEGRLVIDAPQGLFPDG
jgi:16S rRNA processing protein RimM